jgi:hypothetical protein
MNQFDANLETGQRTENLVANWLRSRGSTTIQICDSPLFIDEKGAKRGPKVLDQAGFFTAPDIMTWKDGECMWVETKHKTVFTWWRIGKRWQTGIDAHHYEDYREVKRLTGQRVFITFLHVSSTPASYDTAHDCPPECPTGLFVAEIFRLENTVRIDPRWGRHGMAYWNASVPGQQDGPLQRIATLEQVYSAPGNADLVRKYGLKIPDADIVF